MRRWTAVTDTGTLHIAKDMVPVYTAEKPEVHPHAENFRPEVCARRLQRGMSQTRGSRPACKIVGKHTSCPVHLPPCDVYYTLHADV